MENEKYIRLSDIQKFPIRLNHCDREHGKLDFVLGIESVFDYIDYIEPVDVKPIIRAKWIVEKEKDTFGYLIHLKCSNCEQRNVSGRKPYCPHCGATMDLEENK